MEPVEQTEDVWASAQLRLWRVEAGGRDGARRLVRGEEEVEDRWRPIRRLADDLDERDDVKIIVSGGGMC